MSANDYETRPVATASGWRLKFGPTVYGPLFASEDDAAGFALYVANKYGLDPRCQSGRRLECLVEEWQQS